MKYCKKCLQPNTRPNTKFSAEGVCPACDYHSSLQSVDWDGRLEILQNYLANTSKSHGKYDCIIGVSGGKDSTRQALWVRDKLGLNPLLISLTYPPEQVSDIGVDNLSNLIQLGFDVELLCPAPETWRLLVRESFHKFANWARSTELALFSSVPRLAIQKNIPLIFWGENPALQVGDKGAEGKTGYDGNNLRNSNTLSSGHDWMLELGYTRKDILPYLYPTTKEFDAAKVQIIFLGWFLGDWSLRKNSNISICHGLRMRNELPEITGDLYGTSNLDENWHLLNQMIKFYKFGFGKVTECVNEEIRDQLCTRDDAIELVEEYDGKCSDKYISGFCKYIGISTTDFWDHVAKNAHPALFSRNGNRLTKQFKVGVDI